MPRHVTNARHEWFLPLVGGAEMNRLAPPPRFYVTSRPYPIMDTDSINTGADVLAFYAIEAYNDPMNSLADFVGALLAYAGTGFAYYTNWPPELLNTGGEFLGATLTYAGTGFEYYTNWPPEPLNVAADFVGATLTLALVTYSNWPAEPVNTGADFLGATLT